MQRTKADYRVASHPGGGWLVLRDGDPVARRRDVCDAVGLAMHFAERESMARGGAARVSMASGDLSSWTCGTPSVAG